MKNESNTSWWNRLLREEAKAQYEAVESATPKVDDIKLIESIDSWRFISTIQDEMSEKAHNFRSRYLGFRLIGVALTFVTVVLLSLQKTFFHLPATSGVVVKVLEAAVLLLLAYISVSRNGSENEWALSRLRSELLRRERWLFLVGLGPYQGLAGAECDQVASQRVKRFQSASRDEALESLWNMSGDSVGTYIVFQNSCPSDWGNLSIQTIMKVYASRRAAKEVAWMAESSERCSVGDNRRRYIASSFLFLTVGFIILQLAVVTSQREGNNSVVGFIDLCSLILLGGAMTVQAARSIRQDGVRARIYAYTFKRLSAVSSRIESLLKVPPCTATWDAFRQEVWHFESIMSDQAADWALVSFEERELD